MLFMCKVALLYLVQTRKESAFNPISLITIRAVPRNRVAFRFLGEGKEHRLGKNKTFKQTWH